MANKKTNPGPEVPNGDMPAYMLHKGTILQGNKMGDVLPVHVQSSPRALDYLAINSQVRHLQGDVLTIIDASIQDPTQRKAIKDLIKNTFSAKLNWIYELCGYPEVEDDPASRGATSN